MYVYRQNGKTIFDRGSMCQALREEASEKYRKAAIDMLKQTEEFRAIDYAGDIALPC